MLKSLFSLLLALLLSPQFVFTAPAHIESKDVRSTFETMLTEHAKYSCLTPELCRRAIELLIDQLDPFKSYLTGAEVTALLSASDEVVEAAVRDFRSADYALFEGAYEKMVEAVERRRRLAAYVARFPAIEAPEISLERPLDLRGLIHRWREIAALHKRTASRLEGSLSKNYTKHVEKNLAHFEKEVIGKSPKDQPYIFRTALLKALASALDSQTNFLTPRESKQFVMGMQKKLVGIGAVLRDDLTGLRLTELLKGGPAERDGRLKVDDLIVAVGGEPICGMHIVDSVEMIRGKRGAPVDLTVMREDQVMQVQLNRDEIVFPEERTKVEGLPFGDGKIAHIKVQTFYHDTKSSTTADIRSALEAFLKEGGLKGVILDLRGNPGGLLAEGIATAGLFIDRGIVASLKNSDGSLQHLRNLAWEPTYLGPLVVLVDALSASSSEIVAGALQDYGRSLIVGERTFGKGTFQLCSIPMNGKISNRGEYKVTSGIYYTVSGKSPQLSGVEPDISVPWIYSKAEIGERFGKYPLEGGAIEPQFDDDLSDIPVMGRARIRGLYRLAKQEKEDVLDSLSPTLRLNSQRRLTAHAAYQKRVSAELGSGGADFESMDYQLEEAINITKDLIYLRSLHSGIAPRPS